MTLVRLTIIPVLAFGTLACGAATTEAVPLQLTMTASSSVVATGDTVAFAIQGRGGSLVGVEIIYGDSGTDLYAMGGATSAHVTFRHAYNASGTYQARAVITDALEGQKDATVEVRVN